MSIERIAILHYNNPMDDAQFTARIEKIAAGGGGLARIEGKTVFITGSAPGETVRYRITAEHRSWVQAEMVEVVEAGPDRVTPACALYGKCGGCNLQHLSYTAQLAAKTAILTEAFIRIGGFHPPQPSCFSAEPGFSTGPWEYRNRMQFHGTHGVWGLKARKKSEIIPVADCPIADPGIRAVLQNNGKPKLLMPPGRDRFTVYSRGGLFLSEGGTQRGVVRILERELVLDVGVFFQSNGVMLEKLIADLREIAGTADRNLPMADLYCGVGTFASYLGHLFPHIDLVEENKTALTLARENLAMHPSTAFFARRSEHWADNNILRRYGFMTADPPRQGFDSALAHRLAAEGPPLLAYISCDPATLARDSAVLVKGGYRLKDLRWYDFFPQTAHIETLAVFFKP